MLSRVVHLAQALPREFVCLAMLFAFTTLVVPARISADEILSRQQREDAKHARTLASALRKLDFGEPLLAADHTALKRAAKERHLPALNVCADPGNMPFSSQRRDGLQNKIAAILADEMQTTLTYYWRPLLSRGLTRNTFDTKECDVLMDMPSDYEGIVTTEPVYRTTYVFAWRQDRDLRVETLDDPRLRSLRIGVYQTSSIRTALKRRGIHENVALHTISHDGDLRPENQPWHQIQQVVDGTLDIAGVWGPFAGWMKSRGSPITIQPVNLMESEVPLEFSLSIGVRKADQVLRYKIELALDERKDEIEHVLRSFGVPLVQCSKCYIAGDLPAHGIYEAPLEVEAPAPDPSKIASHQRVTEERVEKWLADGADLDQELANAVLAADRPRIRLLVGKGADPNKLDKQGLAPLHTAARHRKDDVIQLLIELGADPNMKDRDGYTPIVYAALRDHADSIKLLAARGADLEVRPYGDATPIAIAIAEDHYASAIALAEAGADANSRNGEDQLTPLMLAAGREPTQFSLGAGRRRIQRFHPQYPSTLDVSRALLKHGAKLDAKSRTGLTALMLAAAKNQVPLVGLLIQAGADANIASGDGKTSLDIARANGNDQVVSILRLLEQSGHRH